MDESHTRNMQMTLASTFWATLLNDYSPRQIEFFGYLAIQLAFFWIPSAIYLSLPYVFPRFAARLKSQKEEKQPTLAEILECMVVVLRNEVLLMASHLAMLLLRTPSRYRFDAELPSFGEAVRDFFICVVAREVLFYYIHRAMHHPSLYAKIHKKHHRFTAPVALSAQYATVTEHIFANTLPVLIPPMLLRTHIVTMWFFLAWTFHQISTIHSGFTFSRLARRHDAHHEKFNIFFGYLGFLDSFHGTDGRHEEKEKNA